MFPDCTISVDWITHNDNILGLFGTARGTYSLKGDNIPENFWNIPAAWLADIEGGLVKERRIYADLDPALRIMNRPLQGEPDNVLLSLP